MPPIKRQVHADSTISRHNLHSFYDRAGQCVAVYLARAQRAHHPSTSSSLVRRAIVLLSSSRRGSQGAPAASRATLGAATPRSRAGCPCRHRAAHPLAPPTPHRDTRPSRSPAGPPSNAYRQPGVFQRSSGKRARSCGCAISHTRYRWTTLDDARRVRIPPHRATNGDVERFLLGMNHAGLRHTPSTSSARMTRRAVWLRGVLHRVLKLARTFADLAGQYRQRVDVG